MADGSYRPTRWERQRYWHGQLLRSTDLGDQLVQEAQLRWWHNRAIHNAYGVVAGLTVEEFTPPPYEWLDVRPGLAYDLYGRELWLSRPKRVRVPRLIPAGGLTLLAAYPGPLPAHAAPNPAAGASQPPDLVWRPTDEVSMRDGVPLARLNDNGELEPGVGVPVARPHARPYIATGMTKQGSTPWEPWETALLDDEPIPLGLQTRVNTAAAGFTDVPCYFAWVPQSLWDAETVRELMAANDALRRRGMNVLFRIITNAHGHIRGESASSFVFRLWLPGLAAMGMGMHDALNNALGVLAQRLTVGWVGIEHRNEGGEA